MNYLKAIIVSALIIPVAILATIALMPPAGAQNSWYSPGGAGVNGVVQMCLNGSSIAMPCESYNYSNITSQTTTAVKSGAGILHTVCVNTPAASGTVKLYDNTAGSGTAIATITSFASAPACFTYDAAFATGLTVVTAGATTDVTVSYR